MPPAAGLWSPCPPPPPPHTDRMGWVCIAGAERERRCRDSGGGPAPPGEGSSASTGPETWNDKKWSNIQREEGGGGGGRRRGSTEGDRGKTGRGGAGIAQNKNIDACQKNKRSLGHAWGGDDRYGRAVEGWQHDKEPRPWGKGKKNQEKTKENKKHLCMYDPTEHWRSITAQRAERNTIHGWMRKRGKGEESMSYKMQRGWEGKRTADTKRVEGEGGVGR